MVYLEILKYILLLANASYSKTLKLSIIGGHEIDIQKAPYQAAIIEDKSLICGAVIISKYMILTAAHCVEKFVEKEDNIHKIQILHSNFEHLSGKDQNIKFK